jgi:DNA polymerase III alpha subunit
VKAGGWPSAPSPFITTEDETGIANLIIWPDLFEKLRRVILSSSMLGVRGRVQKEGDVIHVVAEELEDLTPLLRSVGGRDAAMLPVPQTRMVPVASARVLLSTHLDRSNEVVMGTFELRPDEGAVLNCDSRYAG